MRGRGGGRQPFQNLSTNRIILVIFIRVFAGGNAWSARNVALAHGKSNADRYEHKYK